MLIETGIRGREELYGAFDPGPLPDRDAAVAELARRYAAAHAPASAEDFAAWSGLPASDVRRAWQDPQPAGRRAGRGTGAGLLPAFDEWLLGWASRDLVLPERHAGEVLRGGIIRAVAIADGRVFGTWRRGRRGVELAPFGRVTAAMRDAVESEAERLGLRTSTAAG